MYSVLSCIIGQHNIWLVGLASLVCLAGVGVTMSLLQRAATTGGLQRYGWNFLTGVAAGASIWCTHFIAMLAYNPGVPVTFMPVLTIVSLLVAVAGSGLGFAFATSGLIRLAPIIGGSFVGLAIAAMHYTGMLAYRVEGIVAWNETYLITSIVLSVVLAAAATRSALRADAMREHLSAAALFVVAIVSLHFTGMTALQITPLNGAADFAGDPSTAMALAVAGMALVIIGAGISSYLIDDRTRFDSYQRLQHMALHDPLTGLPNRTSFTNYLEFELDRAEGTKRKVAALEIDLDRFKEVNDLRGHQAGDEVLKVIADRMTNLLREGEMVARVGGDEFTAIKTFIDPVTLVDFLERLQKVIFAPIEISDFEVSIGASIGVAIYPDDATDRENLLSNADLAMYRAKASATEDICFYESSMDERVRARRVLANDLRDAVKKNELALHYQVQTSISTGEVIGYEALLRWHHPVRGAVPPAEFIPIAEETGLILELGEWVLRTACAAAAKWSQPLKVAINLSPVQFIHSDLPKLVKDALADSGLEAKRLELELTESTIVENKERTLAILNKIKELGVSIALDDFGTGYSSLETLRSFPFDKIKLDRCFMQDIEASPQSKAIVRAVLALGKSLSIPILAEGIETNYQLMILKDEGCDAAQGYFIGRPSPFILDETAQAGLLSA